MSNYIVVCESGSSTSFKGGKHRYYKLEEKLEWYLNNMDVLEYQIITINHQPVVYIMMRINNE